MAKTISDEQMKLSIIINGNSAQKELFDLEKSTRSLTEENKALGLQKKLLIKQGKEETAEYKTLTASIKANNAEITSNKTKMKLLQDQIGLTGLTMAQLQGKAAMLRNTLRNLVPGSEDFIRYQAELSSVNARLGELSGRSRTAQSSMGSLADTFNRYQGMALAAIAALTGMALSIQKIIDINGKLADAQSDVMKTTQMTKEEVDDLTKSFGLLHTRSSRIDLLGIAEQGGRIGIAKAEIGDFVNVMNKASVALGDSFSGGAEEVANKLGKIKFLFQETKNLNVEESYNSIGSAINDLGANGVASEANIADFTTRIGSLTDVLKPTIQETLALGAAFEESGIESEVSARAYGIFMKQASTESGKFAKVMGISQKAVEDMINTNPLDFMLKFSEGMKGMSATETAKTLDSLGISADGANKVIGAMGNNTARFRELIDLSNGSFASGTSLINEYNIKNNNLAATLEKISKTVSGWFSSETFIKWLTVGVQALGQMIGATDDTNNSISSLANKFMFFVKTLALILVTLFNYQVALKIVALWTTRVGTATAWSNLVMNIHYGLLVIQEVATKALAFAQSFLTLKLSEVKKAFVALSASMNLNPYVALITIVTSLIAAYAIFKDSADETSKVFENQVLVNNKVTQQLSDHKQKISDLVAIMQDENATIDQKKEALKQLQTIAGGYLDTLTQENIATAEGTRLIGRYIKAIDELAKVQAIQDVKAELRKEKLKQDNKVLALSQEKKATKNEGSSLAGDDGKWFGMGSRNKKEIQLEINDEKRKAEDLGFQITAIENTKTRAVTELQTAIRIRNEKLKKAKKDSKQFKELTQDIKNDEKALNILIGLESTDAETPQSKYEPLDTSGAKGTGTKKNPNSSQEEIARRTLDEANKNKEDLLALDRQYQDDKLSIMEDGAAKEIIIEQERYLREIADLEKKKVHTDELSKLDEDIAKAKESKNKSEQNRLEALRTGWDAKNKIYDDKINAIQEGKLKVHNKKIEIINEKASKDLLDKEEEAFNLKKQSREAAFYNELAGLDLTESEKSKRIRAFNKEEIEIQKVFLIKKIDDLKSIMSGNVIDGIDFSLMSPESKLKLESDLAFVMNALAKINNANPNKAGKEIDLGLGGEGKDILGFSQQQWDDFAANIEKGTIGIQTLQMAYQLASQVVGQLDQYMTASENATLKKTETIANQKKRKLDQQLKQGIISQTEYNKRSEKLDQEVEDKKFEIELKQAKRKKAMSIVDTVVNTAVSIMQAYSQLGPIGGSIAAVLIGVLGALQVATIAKQPMPTRGYEEGLYPEYVKREQDGKTFKSKYQGKTRSGLVSNTSHFLVAENGPEMVIDNKAWTQMDPAVKDALVRDLRGIKGFEQGYYNQELKRYEVPAATTSSTTSSSSSNNNEQMMQMMMAVVSENTAVMKDLRDRGVVGKFFKNDLQSAKNIQDSIKDYNELRNNSKK